MTRFKIILLSLLCIILSPLLLLGLLIQACFGDINHTLQVESDLDMTGDEALGGDIGLTVSNEYGEDSVTLSGMITARIQAPGEAVIQWNSTPNQIVKTNQDAYGNTTDENNNPIAYDTIRAPIDTFINAYAVLWLTNIVRLYTFTEINYS